MKRGRTESNEPVATAEIWTKKLREAAEMGNIPKIKEALEHVDVDTPTKGCLMMDVTALHFALGCHENEAAAFLLDHGADPNSMPGYRRPLHAAANSKNLEGFELLLKRGADPRLLDSNGQNVSYLLQQKIAECNKNSDGSGSDEEEMYGEDDYELQEMLELFQDWKPALLQWSPDASVHSQYSRGFRDATFTLLCVMHRFGVPRDVRVFITQQIAKMEFSRTFTHGYWPRTVHTFTEMEEFDRPAGVCLDVGF
jgi:hypothetical protein